MGITIVLALLVGLYLGNKLPYWIADLVTYVQNRQTIRIITPNKVDEKKLCKAPHSWINTSVDTKEGIKEHKICRVCGFISGMNKMAKPEAIDMVEENNKIKEVEARLQKDFLNFEDNEIKKFFDEELKNGLSFEKLMAVHDAGITFSSRFFNYKISKIPEIERELKRGNA